MTTRALALAILIGGLALPGGVTAADEMTLTGSVGDAMCGAKHMMDNATGCTKGCVAKGSDYALIVDGKAYTLKTSDDEARQQLEALAGEQATVTGDVSDDTISVASVAAAQ